MPQDRRVWKESEALVDAGYDVSVIAPRRREQRRREHVGNVTIHRYAPTRERAGELGFVLEFSSAWVRIAMLSAVIFAWDGFAAIQACNPPDIFFTVALPYKLAGCPFVFDQHDLSPELYVARFGRSGGIVFRCLELLERATFRTADHVIAANRPQAEIPLTRGKKAPDEVTVVSNGPVLPQADARPSVPDRWRSKPFLCCWVGAMGAVDDGVDLAIHAIAHLVHEIGRVDCHFVFLGDGEAFGEVTRLASELGVSDWITFTGWVDHETVLDCLASADVGLQPDPKNPRTDKATAVKTLEYMAFGVPVVAFDLEETRRTVGSAAEYATPNDPRSFAVTIDGLLSDPDRRRAMGETGRRLIRDGLAWDYQRVAYVRVYDALAPPRFQGGAGDLDRRRRSRTHTGSWRMTDSVDIAIVGAGPYGLAAAAHLRAAGRETRVFGEPLQFWQTQTPVAMVLRSPYLGSDIGGSSTLTLRDYETDSGRAIPRPIPVNRFVEYGKWFQQNAVPEVDRRDVRTIAGVDSGFRVTVDGDVYAARRVVVATGVGAFAWTPPVFAALDHEIVSHSLDHHTLDGFAGRRVTVIGGGQSALETAALLHEGGSDVDVLVRAPSVRWLSESSWKHTTWPVNRMLYAPPDVGPALASHLVAHPGAYRRFPRQWQDRLATRSVRPAGAGWLRPRLRDITIRTGVQVVEVTPCRDRVHLRLDDGTQLRVDHVLLATGYRVDLSRYSFLASPLVEAIRGVNGYPRLSRGFETTMPGLHVVGAPAAWSFGPLMRFVAGSGFAARLLTRWLAR